MEKKTLALMAVAVFILIACAGTEIRSSDVGKVVIQRPVWSVGDTWTYKTETGKIFTDSVVKHESGHYVIQEQGLRLSFIYYTDDLAYSHNTNAKGRIFYKNDPPMWFYTWPLERGKKWHQRIYWVDDYTHNTIDHYSKVVGVETIKTPAGQFEAVKIIRTAGVWTYTYWYSPTVKNYVKWVTVNDNGTFSSELVGFQVAPSKTTGQPTGMK